jgi:hypothetical protein
VGGIYALDVSAPPAEFASYRAQKRFSLLVFGVPTPSQVALFCDVRDAQVMFEDLVHEGSLKNLFPERFEIHVVPATSFISISEEFLEKD